MEKRTKLEIVFGLVIFGVAIAGGICVGFFGIERFPSHATPEEPISEYKNLTAMFDTFNQTIRYLQQNDVPYVLVSKSLVGAKRNFPPGPSVWDLNVDFMILKDGKETATILHNMTNDLNMEFTKEKSVTKMRNKKFGERSEYDVHLRSIISHGKHWGYNASLVEAEECEFWGITASCPKEFDGYLMAKFGGRWKSFARKRNDLGIGYLESRSRVDLTLPENKKDLISMIPSAFVERLDFR